MVLAFIDLLATHKEEHPNGVRMVVLENEGAFTWAVATTTPRASTA